MKDQKDNNSNKTILNDNVKCIKGVNVPNLRFKENNHVTSQKINNITKFHKQGYYSNEKYLPTNKYFIFSGSNIINHKMNFTNCNKINANEKDYNNFKIEKDDILLVRSGNVGDYAIVDNNIQNAIFGSYLIKFKIDNNIVINHYFGYFYQSNSFKKQLNKIIQSSANTNINAENIKSIVISYPSLVEQNKIATFLSLIDERIETQNKIIEDLELYKKSILDLIFANINESIQLGEICNITKGQQVNGNQLSNVGLYYFMNGGITQSGFYNQWNTRENTISISEGGNSCGFIKFNKEKFWSGGHCYTLQNISNKFNNKFIYHYLKFMELNIMNLRVGSGLPNIQKKALASFSIKTLSLDKQIEIAKILDFFDEKINIEKDMLELYKKQKAYLLQKMFI